MNNAKKFKKHFGIYATELWCMGEKDFLKWLNSEAADEWIPAYILPKEDGDYLVKYNLQSKYGIKHLYDVMSFAKDLYKVDNEDFIAKKGESGWYYLHPTFGYCEEKRIDAWMPLPEPYREEGAEKEFTQMFEDEGLIIHGLGLDGYCAIEDKENE